MLLSYNYLILGSETITKDRRGHKNQKKKKLGVSQDTHSICSNPLYVLCNYIVAVPYTNIEYTFRTKLQTGITLPVFRERGFS